MLNFSRKDFLILAYMPYMVWEFQPQRSQSPSPSSGEQHGDSQRDFLI